ncbi:MAG: TonB-dependent receptor [Betaproteobacteria bacterium]|nr:TonB-dependent receptor [Betaproteobacteria bacterium]
MRLKKLAQAVALIGISSQAVAQSADQPVERVQITGSSIKRIQSEGALPLQIITRQDLDRDGIVTAEQLMSTLNINANSSDNLASNADVVSGAQRGNNGASSANLRGQGADSTLVLLNGRRIASHGMKGQAVDLNSIPMAAVDRIEILKDGASSTYGTDAIGGVINFILRKNYTGLEAQAFVDNTQHPGGNIKRTSLVGGFGDLEKDKYNVLITLAHSQNDALKGNQRNFVNTFQPERGLSVDTRGDPFATVFASNLGNNILSKKGSSTGPIQPGTTQAMNGINVLDLPGQAGCGAIDGMAPYDEKLWSTPSAKWGCAWDTGRAAVLQQPVDNTNFVSRGTFKFNQHQITAEAVGSHVEVMKSFSPNQISPGSAFGPATWYPLNATTKATYDTVFNSIAAVFPTIAGNYGSPIAYRWRCMPCGNREISTVTDAGRFLIGADGPIGKWDYRVGLSKAYSQSQSTLGSGYQYLTKLQSALGSGLINPFLMPGQQQTQAGLDLLQGASAYGAVLYGGKTTVTELDATVSGEVYTLPAGPVMAAFGIDRRKEGYSFNGTPDSAIGPSIFNAPFDTVNSLAPLTRTISAYYGEVLVPVTKKLELTFSARQDTYSGFGKTTNPKVSFRFAPTEKLLFRGSYNTGFRVPSFNQIFNGFTIAPYSGKDLVDPATCPSLKVSSAPGCGQVTPDIVTGGKLDLGPETAKQGSVGVVWQPVQQFSTNLDLWEIRRENTIQSLDLPTLLANYSAFSNRFIRDASNTLVLLDQRWVNAGGSVTRGIEVGAKLNGKLGAGKWVADLDGSYLLEKKSRPLPNTPYGASEVGRFVTLGDLGLRWKHTASFTYKQGDWSTTLTQIYRSGYKDQVLPGVANGTVTPSQWNPDVKSYQLFNLSASYTGFKNLTLTAGVKNLFDTDPPFANAYDSNTGAGSSWEPRVADPRGRSLTLLANYKFF